MHHVVATECAENEAEHRGTDQDQENHADDLSRRFADWPQQGGERRLAGREQNGADGTD
jgi:hypothetical protein